jgi:uncharacterized membrane protein YdjX (TVP38/TMEM64 family)
MSATTIAVLMLLLGLTVFLLFIPMIEWPGGYSFEDFTVWLRKAPSLAVVSSLLLGPLLGLPLGAFLVAVGIAFPLDGAVEITAATLFVHHLLLFALSKTSASIWLQKQLMQRKLLLTTRANKTFSDNFIFLALASWIPGLSYVVKLVYTALLGIPFRTYVFAGTTTQLIAALPFLILGDAAGKGHLMWAGVLLLILVVLTLLINLFKNHFLRRKTQTGKDPFSTKD